MTVDFYTSVGDPFVDASATFSLWRTWKKDGADIEGWIDSDYGKYQSLNLIAQVDDELFLMGFVRFDTGDWVDLYFVDMNPETPPRQMLRKIDKKSMTCSSGCSFEHAAGLQIVSNDRFEVYAAKGFSENHATGMLITLNYFRAD